jgi:microcystin-dependent protein
VAQPFVGTIVIFGSNFAPQGWHLCDGSLLPINQYTAVFSLLGTFYGGNGTTTFGLPDLRGRVPIGPGQGTGLSPYTIGQAGGVETVVLTTGQLPTHTHSQPATAGDETTNRPNGAVPARGGVYATPADSSALQPTSPAGSNQPHVNIQPYLAINYIIALQGIFPSRN